VVAVFDTRGPEVRAPEVDAFEATLPRPLPSDDREFLLTQNGGSTYSWWPPELGGPDVTDLQAFYGISSDEISLVATREVFSDSLPGAFLAVAYDDCGGQVCLSLQDEDHGAVWFYDPEREFDPSEPTDPLLLVPWCASFTELVQTLEPSPDPEEALRRLRAALPFEDPAT
jgi:hypothetical protein